MLRPYVHARHIATLAILLASVPAAAQTERGSIVGQVSDSTGAVLPGVKVTVTSLATNLTMTHVTNDRGLFEAPFLTPGSYKVTATLDGFNDAVIQEVEVNVGRRATANLTLFPATLKAEVTVTARAPLVQQESASVGQVVDGARLAHLPTGDRNVYEFMLLTSNVTQPPGGNAVAFRLESGGSFAVSGTRPSSLTFKIDGLANNDQGFGTPTITPSLDAVQEFQIQNNAYSAEFEGIGQVNVATKSGTSVFHGSLFEYYRDEALQPTHPLLDRKTPLDFDQFGGTIGGPVPFSDRTFFFFSYEGRRHDQLGLAQAFVPTAAQRNGDFSAELGGCLLSAGQTVPLLSPAGMPTGDCARAGQIFDPLTTIPNPAFDPMRPVSAFNPQFIRQPFAGNRIPSDRISQVARQIIGLQLPLPNFAEDRLTNFQGLAGVDIVNNQYAIRIDHNFSAKDRLYARLAVQDNVRFNRPVLPFLQKHLQGKGWVFSANWTRVLGARAVNELRVGYVRGDYGDFIDEIDPTRFGIRNTTLPTLPRLWLQAGNINYGGFSGSVLEETQHTYQVADNLSFITGRHAVKVGFQVDYNRYRNAEQFGANGTAIFNGLYTIPYNAGVSAAREHSLADFLLGLSSSTSLNRAAVSQIQNAPWSIYIQDDWKVNDRLTLGLGLRYEYHQPWKESGLGGAGVDLSGEGTLCSPDPAVVRLSNTRLVVPCESPRIVPTDRNDFGPRVSAVWRPFKRSDLAIRLGYGLYYSDMTQFFNWRGYEPLRGPLFQGGSGDFLRPASRLETLFPEENFIQGGGVVPFFPSGVSGLTAPVIAAGGVLALDLHHTPYSHQWSLSVQKEILPRTLLDVTYQGAVGRNLPTQWIFNQPPASPVPVNFRSTDPQANPYLRRPFDCCTISSFVYNGNILESAYNALTIKLDKRFSDGYQFLASYTYSTSFDHGSEVFQIGNTFNILSDSRDLERDWGRSTFDVPHRFVASGSVVLPFGRGRRWLSGGGILEALAGGWRLAGTLTIQSGFPFTPLIRNRRANTGYPLSTERGDLVGNPYWSDEEWDRLLDEWKRNGDIRLFLINPAAISLDYAPGTFGNIPRNFFRAPYGRRLDLSVAKSTRLRGRVQLEVRGDILNATSDRLHRPDISQSVRANNLLTDPTMGSIGTYRQQFNPRVIQLSARLSF